MENTRPEYTFRNLLVAIVFGIMLGALGYKLFGMFDFAESSRANREVIEALATKGLDKPRILHLAIDRRFATAIVCHAGGMSIIGVDRDLMTRSYDPSTDDLRMIKRGTTEQTEKPINCFVD